MNEILPPSSRWHVLYAVFTVREAGEVWGKDYDTVMMAMATGKLAFRQSGGIYLIERMSLEKLWGQPKHKINSMINFPIHKARKRR